MMMPLRRWLLLGAFFIVAHCEDTLSDAMAKIEGEAEEVADPHEAEDAEHMGSEGEGNENIEDLIDKDGDKDGDEEEIEDDESAMEQLEITTPEQMRALHKKMDANGNGKVSMVELTDFAQSMRRAMAKFELDGIMTGKDKNKDGKLDFDEFLGDPGRKSETQQHEKHDEFKELDVNSDKFVDADELASLFHHHTNDKVETTLTNLAMKTKDTNQDGKVSLKEFYVHYEVEGQEPLEITEADKDVFSKLDTDSSGALTLKELRAWESGSFEAEQAMKRLFAHADSNNDNVVTVEELEKARHEIANDHDTDAQLHLSMWVDHHGGEL